MTDPQNTVFISYRRASSKYIARSIFLELRARGYDIFMDVESIDSGQFETIIFNQIAARAHFLLILAPGTLDRCTDPDDMVRRELAQALALQRNVVPIVVDGFDFGDIDAYLPDDLAVLSGLNGPKLYHEYFEAAIDMLCDRFLKQPMYGTIAPTPQDQSEDVARIMAETTQEPAPTDEQLNAEQVFQRALTRDVDDRAGKIADYTEVIRLAPDDPAAFNNRAIVYDEMGQYDDAVADYDEAVRLDPEFTDAFYGRGITHYNNQQYEAAIADYSEAIRIDPNYAIVYNNRGIAHYDLQNYEQALSDLNESIRLNPDNADTYNNRGEMYFALERYEDALADFKTGNGLAPGDQFIIAGLAISQSALGNADEARRLWQVLLAMDERHGDPEWVKAELYWEESLADEAQKIIAGIS